MSTPVDNNTAPAKQVIESTPAVKIVDLEPRNKNQTFVGKIVEIEVVTKNGKKDNQPRRYLKGVVGDETGVIRFDLAEQNDTIFNIGDIVSFDKIMNRVSKEKYHYIEVKRYGTYEILSSAKPITVNTSVNKSETAVPPREVDASRPPRTNSKPAKSANNNNSNVNNNNSQNNGRGNRTNNNNNNNSNHNNNNNNRNNNRQHSNNNNNSNNNNQRQHANEPRHPTFVRPTIISKLEPGTSEQVVIGQVVSLETQTKTIRERDATFAKGTIADQTGSINFDVKLTTPINVNDVVVFSNVFNKVDNRGYHHITIGRYGFYTVLSTGRIDTTADNNLSKIEYVKKTI